MKYRSLKCGEVVEATDEYQSVFSQGEFIPVSECTVGQQLLDCNVPYYRRPLKIENSVFIVKKDTTDKTFVKL